MESRIKKYPLKELALVIILILMLGRVGYNLGTAQASSPQILTSIEKLTVSLYEDVSPSVVKVTNHLYKGGFYKKEQKGIGSGFVWDQKGHIITNYHVVAEDGTLKVTFKNGRTISAHVIGDDSRTDLAVLKVNSMPNTDRVKPVKLGDSSLIRPGQLAVAIGSPFGLHNTMSLGIIGATGRSVETRRQIHRNLIQTDAAINPGNSGGPLFDIHGQVIGITTMIATQNGAFNGVGFAIPVNTVKRIVPKLIQTGTYPHPWLGIEGLTLTPELAHSMRSVGVNLGTEKGLLVIDVWPGGPADQAGIRGCRREVWSNNRYLPVGGDVITAINGTQVESMKDLVYFLEDNTTPGQTVVLTVFREAQKLTVQARLGTAPEEWDEK